MRCGRAELGWVTSGRAIVLNDSAIPKIIRKNYFNFSRFYKVLQQFECRQGNLYMTANRNFVRFVHS